MMDLMGPGLGCYRRGQEGFQKPNGLSLLLLSLYEPIGWAWFAHGFMEHQSTHRAFIGCSGKLTKAFKSSKQETKKEKRG
ncbi:hypothetical protein BDE02_14G016500 [Populus trichocarpa]|nr:hypothetical protein BDE02_14G016500 [Populus trichocarpa]